MKKLVIIGAGGMGRSVYCIALGCIGYDENFIIKGFIDDNLNSLDGFSNYPPIISSIDDYVIEKDDVFVCSIGNSSLKRILCEKIKSKGGQFFSLIHRTAIIRQNAMIDTGCIIADYASIGADARIGCNSLVQSYAIVAHDCIIGDYVRIDTHCVCVGGVIVETGAMVHTGAILSHNVVVEENAHVGAASFVIRRVKAGTTAFGSPAKCLK